MEVLTEKRYNYFGELLNLNESLVESKLVNTFELFSFGTLKDYMSQPDQFIPLDGGLLLQLTKLSILGLCNDYEGSTISTAKLEEYGLPENVVSEVISLIDEGVIDVKFDDLSDQWHIGQCGAIRDSFDSSLYKLRLLKEEDIGKRSLQNAHDYLAGWYKLKLAKKWKNDRTDRVKRDTGA